MAFLGSTSMVLALDPQELYFSNDYGSCVTLTAAGPLAGAVAKVQCNSDNTVTLGESCDQDRHFWESGSTVVVDSRIIFSWISVEKTILGYLHFWANPKG